MILVWRINESSIEFLTIYIGSVSPLCTIKALCLLLLIHPQVQAQAQVRKRIECLCMRERDIERKWWSLLCFAKVKVKAYA